MKQVVDNCVSCDLPCVGSACPYSKHVVEMCEHCGEEIAMYVADGIPLCEECLCNELQEQWEDLSLADQADALGIVLRDAF